MILIYVLCFVLLGLHLTKGDKCQVIVSNEELEGPTPEDGFECWLQAMRDYRQTELKRINYSDHNYLRPELQWTQRTVLQPQMMAHDRDFYDPTTRNYTVDKYVKGLYDRYGGIDSVLVWPTYPNIGIDDRNTDDMIRDMPGGVEGIKRMIADFHGHGVKVFFPIHPWDQGTRDPGHDWSYVLPATMAEIGADGLNGDTMYSINKEYFDNSVAHSRPLALEPEDGLISDAISDLPYDVLSWYEWGFRNNTAVRPLVSRNKWLERRHQVHICDRWSHSKIYNLQSAFFNGVGLETWENVWGIWNGLTDRDCQAIKMVANILRHFHDFVVSEEWTPFYKTVHSGGDALVFASEWPLTVANSSRSILWTLINRGDNDVDGQQLNVPHLNGNKYYDLWHGVELQAHIANDHANLSFGIEKHGFGAVLSANDKHLPQNFDKFLAQMRQYSERPLTSYSAANVVVKQTIVPIACTQAYASAPSGMISIEGANYTFEVSGTEIEPFDDSQVSGVDVQYPWESEPSRHHRHVVAIDRFYIDRTPVTNAQYAKFVNGSDYHPLDDHNYLRDWHNGSYPDGWSLRPVTWVSIEDARAYCRWTGRRLPHEWEWQYAAQGLDGRQYPWGDRHDPTRVPEPVVGRTVSSPAEVTSFANGSSPFGALHMVGNVWQWTDEYVDEHTRAAVLRGGSYYLAQTTDWYFPSNATYYNLKRHNKYLLMAPSLDRAATLGFRCAADSDSAHDN